ncbi:condensation domain-containing protein, partial [Actinoalloteichus spitiensis]|uniref:condensation domain-containing protein n=1 Tax=Actinoalloteichus spitiensis TaxID=252394 RepID=UPI001FE1B4C8
MQALVVLQNTPSQPVVLSGVEAVECDLPREAAQFEVSWHFEPTSTGGLRALVEFSTDLFEVDTIRRWSGHWLRAAELFGADPGQPVGDVPLLSETEYQQVVTDWNTTDRPVPAVDLA